MFDKLRKYFTTNSTAIGKLQAEQSKRLRFEMKESVIKVDIVGEIDEWWGFGVRELNYQLSQSPQKSVEVFIHSGGGDLIEGIAIANTLRNHQGQVTTIGVGMVGSAATVIHAAADKGRALMMQGATYMIHEVQSVGVGRAEDIRKTANTVDIFNDVIAEMYTDKIHEKTPNAKADIVAMMREETYMTAEQSVELGFADAIYQTTKITNSMKETTALDALLAKAKLLNEVTDVAEAETDVATEPNSAPEHEVLEDVPVQDTVLSELQTANETLQAALIEAINAVAAITNRVTALEKARNLTAAPKNEAPNPNNALEKAANILQTAMSLNKK